MRVVLREFAATKRRETDRPALDPCVCSSSAGQDCRLALGQAPLSLGGPDSVGRFLRTRAAWCASVSNSHRRSTEGWLCVSPKNPPPARSRLSAVAPTGAAGPDDRRTLRVHLDGSGSDGDALAAADAFDVDKSELCMLLAEEFHKPPLRAALLERGAKLGRAPQPEEAAAALADLLMAVCGEIPAEDGGERADEYDFSGASSFPGPWHLQHA